jgi:hypothetical protein
MGGGEGEGWMESTYRCVCVCVRACVRLCACSHLKKSTKFTSNPSLSPHTHTHTHTHTCQSAATQCDGCQDSKFQPNTGVCVCVCAVFVGVAWERCGLRCVGSDRGVAEGCVCVCARARVRKHTHTHPNSQTHTYTPAQTLVSALCVQRATRTPFS